MRPILVLSFFLLAFQVPPAAAYKWTEVELKAMPEYCQARYSKDSALYEQWAKVIGPGFIHTHHYCDGLGWLMRYYGAKSTMEKRRILQSAYGSFMYMVPRVDESYPMRPELYMNLGTVLALQGKDGEALQSMLKAIEFDPKLARAYSVAASHYEKLKKKDEALKVVTEGLRQIPDSSSLQRIYVKLGGGLPYPEPALPRLPQQAAESPEALPPDTAVRVPDPEVVNVASDKQEVQPEADSSSTIGSPSNPWCRFCPPEPSK